MTITPHAIVGAGIGLAFKNPWLVVPTALASHFLLDTIPHWDPDLDKMREALPFIIPDAVVASILVAVTAYIHPGHVYSIALGSVVALIPDFAEGGWRVLFDRRPPYISSFHSWLHTKRLSRSRGIIMQLAFVVLVLALIW